MEKKIKKLYCRRVTATIAAASVSSMVGGTVRKVYVDCSTVEVRVDRVVVLECSCIVMNDRNMSSNGLVVDVVKIDRKSAKDVKTSDVSLKMTKVMTLKIALRKVDLRIGA